MRVSMSVAEVGLEFIDILLSGTPECGQMSQLRRLVKSQVAPTLLSAKAALKLFNHVPWPLALDCDPPLQSHGIREIIDKDAWPPIRGA